MHQSHGTANLVSGAHQAKVAESRPANASKQSDGGDSLISQRDAAAETGMSERRQVTAVRVANVPEEEFDAAVEGDEKTTITKLAKLAPELAPEGPEQGRMDQDGAE